MSRHALVMYDALTKPFTFISIGLGLAVPYVDQLIPKHGVVGEIASSAPGLSLNSASTGAKMNSKASG